MPPVTVPAVVPVTVPITRPALGPDEAAAVARVIASGWIMQGPEVAAFEQEFAAYVGAPSAVAVANGTVALELALRALGVGPGDEVITVSHSFIATANAVLTVGAHPVLVDVDAATFSLDPARAEVAASPRTKAVLCTHQLGFACDVARLVAWARARHILVVEDAACAIGTEFAIGGHFERLGIPHGDVATFSFHPRKVLTTGEGGMITTRDPSVAERVRRLRQHGLVGLPPSPRPAGAPDGYQIPATNARMTDMAAAIGRVQLARLDGFVAERRRLASLLMTALKGHPVLAAPHPGEGMRPNWQSFPTTVAPGSWDARAVMSFLEARGIASRAGLTNAHEEPAYTHAATGRWTAASLTVSEDLRRRTVMLPLFHGMTDAEVAAITAALADLARAAA
jgi:dTDP-4-amino-4,6-dideoxygalactose transaminase